MKTTWSSSIERSLGFTYLFLVIYMKTSRSSSIEKEKLVLWKEAFNFSKIEYLIHNSELFECLPSLEVIQHVFGTRDLCPLWLGELQNTIYRSTSFSISIIYSTCFQIFNSNPFVFIKVTISYNRLASTHIWNNYIFMLRNMTFWLSAEFNGIFNVFQKKAAK